MPQDFMNCNSNCTANMIVCTLLRSRLETPISCVLRLYYVAYVVFVRFSALLFSLLLYVQRDLPINNRADPHSAEAVRPHTAPHAIYGI